MKQNPRKKYRLKVNAAYCSLNYEFHADGVAIPDTDLLGAHVCDHVNTANAIAKRTHELRDNVKKSMLSDWPKFKPLDFSGYVTTEEFLVDEEVQN